MSLKRASLKQITNSWEIWWNKHLTFVPWSSYEPLAAFPMTFTRVWSKIEEIATINQESWYPALHPQPPIKVPLDYCTPSFSCRCIAGRQTMVLWHKFNISQGIWRRGAREVTKSNSWQGWGVGQPLHCQEQKSHRLSYKRQKMGRTKYRCREQNFPFFLRQRQRMEKKISRQSCVLSFKGKSGVLEEGESFKGWSVLTLTRVKQKRSGDWWCGNRKLGNWKRRQFIVSLFHLDEESARSLKRVDISSKLWGFVCKRAF